MNDTSKIEEEIKEVQKELDKNKESTSSFKVGVLASISTFLFYFVSTLLYIKVYLKQSFIKPTSELEKMVKEQLKKISKDEFKIIFMDFPGPAAAVKLLKDKIIIINPELVKNFEMTSGELRAVLAHEIGHIAHYDSYKTLVALAIGVGFSVGLAHFLVKKITSIKSTKLKYFITFIFVIFFLIRAAVKPRPFMAGI